MNKPQEINVSSNNSTESDRLTKLSNTDSDMQDDDGWMTCNYTAFSTVFQSLSLLLLLYQIYIASLSQKCLT